MSRVIHAREWYSDGWTGLDTYVEISTDAEITALLYLPDIEGAISDTKTVSICDGTSVRAVQLKRGTPINLGLARVPEGTQPLQVYVSDAEPALNDERVLGVVLRLFDNNGKQVPWADVSEAPRQVEPSTLHHDYVLAAKHVNEAQYLLQINPTEPPIDAVLHFLMVGHMTGASPNAELQQEAPVDLDFTSENVLIVPQSRALQRVRESVERAQESQSSLPSSEFQKENGKKKAWPSKEKKQRPPKSLAPGTHAFIEGGFCLSEEHGGGALVFGWALHDPEDEIILVTEGGTEVSIERCFRRVRDDVSRAFPTSPWASRPSAFIGFVPGLQSSDELSIIGRSEGNETVLSKKRGFESLKGKPADIAKQIFSIMTPADEFAKRVLAADWPLLSRALADQSGRHRSSTTRKLTVGELPVQPKVSVIVPLYGRFDFVESQIMEFARDPFLRDAGEIIYVVDDPSIWAEAERLAIETCELFDFSVSLIGDGANRGFSGANNLGTSVARGDFLLFLNSDVIPTTPGWLDVLMGTLTSADDVGAVAPRLVFPDGGIQHAGMAFRYNASFKVWTNIHPAKGLAPELDEGPARVEVPAVTGACLLVRRDHLDSVGGWDEGYLIGDFEDSDLCLALRDRGLRIIYDRSVTLVHLERQSFCGLGDADFRQLVVLANAARHQERWAHILEAGE